MSNKLSATEQKVTQLFEKVEEQNKSAAGNAEVLRDLMVRIENLGENMNTMKTELICLGDPQVQEAEEELNRLQDPVSLTIPVSKGPKL